MHLPTNNSRLIVRWRIFMEVEPTKQFLRLFEHGVMQDLAIIRELYLAGYIEIDLQSSKKRTASDNDNREREVTLGNLKPTSVGNRVLPAPDNLCRLRAVDALATGKLRPRIGARKRKRR
jgi:hypothetical protein